MSKIYKADNIIEALKIAEKFKLEGKYNLFRGQAQNWEVIPTAGRLTKEKFEESKEKLERLFYYINTENSLKKYSKKIDTFFAIAQHYGIPTNYIDFTTNLDIAFYFATNSNFNKPQQNCVIICLNETVFSEFIEFTKVIYKRDEVHPPYVSKIDVENLWRLQAQSGCFLYTPYFKIESFYNFDRIIFPFTSPFEKLTKKEVYPERKSELEILLDHYFDYETRIEGGKRFKKFAEELNIPIKKLLPHDHFAILKEKEIHKSWYSYTYRKWNFPLVENWQSTENEKTIKIFLAIKKNQTKQISFIIDELTKEFILNNVNRNTPLKFEVNNKPKFSKKVTNIINKSCLRIWDGTRNLPYTNDEIISIIANYVFLEIQKNKSTTNTINEDELITLEITNKYGSCTRCKANANSVVSAFRDDINNIVINSMPRPIPSELLLHINKARYIFDFKKLVDLFKLEMVAYQVLNNSYNNNPVIFYTPAQIMVLGYA